MIAIVQFVAAGLAAVLLLVAGLLPVRQSWKGHFGDLARALSGTPQALSLVLWYSPVRPPSTSGRHSSSSNCPPGAPRHTIRHMVSFETKLGT
jgi:hypothetical protein